MEPTFGTFRWLKMTEKYFNLLNNEKKRTATEDEIKKIKLGHTEILVLTVREYDRLVTLVMWGVQLRPPLSRVEAPHTAMLRGGFSKGTL